MSGLWRKTSRMFIDWSFCFSTWLCFFHIYPVMISDILRHHHIIITTRFLGVPLIIKPLFFTCEPHTQRPHTGTKLVNPAMLPVEVENTLYVILSKITLVGLHVWNCWLEAQLWEVNGHFWTVFVKENQTKCWGGYHKNKIPIFKP